MRPLFRSSERKSDIVFKMEAEARQIGRTWVLYVLLLSHFILYHIDLLTYVCSLLE